MTVRNNGGASMDYIETENWVHNQSNSNETVDVTNKNMNSSMTPTPLEYSYCSTHRTATAVGLFVVFTSIVMVVGVLTVYFTSSKVTMQKCELKFVSTTPHTTEYMYGPRSVAVGYFNNDTWLDIAVANQAVNHIAIFLGYGNGSFASHTTCSTGENSSPYMVAVGDFNNDYQLDIAVANFGTNNIGIFLGLGDGSFANQLVTSTASSRPLWIHIVDFNNDTLLDMVTANYGTDSISLLSGFGNGSFLPPITYPTGYDSLPFAVVVGDFNNDNKLDFAIANSGTDNVGILLGTGNGSLPKQKTFSTGLGSHPYSLAVGDFNNDTWLDITVANYGNNSIGVFLNEGHGIFAIQTMYSIGTASPYSIAIDDFNKDSLLDK